MAVRVKDLLNLEIMKNFSVVAGEKGLNRVVEATEILDFEFTSEGEAYRESGFDGKSIVLSVFLFAKDRPELILDAVKKLIAQNVQALAYKPVFFKTLPQEALKYADEMNFPILKFGHDEFFEDVIFAAREMIERDRFFSRAEFLIGRLLDQELTEKENEEACRRMSPFLGSKLTVVFVETEKDSGLTEHIFTQEVLGIPDRSGAVAAGYQGKLVLILSQPEELEADFDVRLRDFLRSRNLSSHIVNMGISNMHGRTALDKAVKEAFWTQKIAGIEEKSVKYYRDLGIYKLIISHINSEETREFMEEYLRPIFAEEDRDSDLLKTAAQYVMTDGDIAETANRLFCHKNTIRYRIGKLQEKLDPDASEKVFFLDLAAAMKIYMLLNDER